MRDEGGLVSLQAAVETQHGCQAVYREAVHVHEEHDGRTVWDGEVIVFDLLDHPSATIVYGWSDPVQGSENHRFYAVLHAGPVDSPEKAVAAIESEYRESKGGS